MVSEMGACVSRKRKTEGPEVVLKTGNWGLGGNFLSQSLRRISCVQKREAGEPEAVIKCGKRAKSRKLGKPGRISCWLVCKNVKLVNPRR